MREISIELHTITLLWNVDEESRAREVLLAEFLADGDHPVLQHHLEEAHLRTAQGKTIGVANGDGAPVLERVLVASGVDLVVAWDVEVEGAEVGEAADGGADVEGGEESLGVLACPFGVLVRVDTWWDGEVQDQVFDLLEYRGELAGGWEGTWSLVRGLEGSDSLLTLESGEATVLDTGD